MSTLVEVVAERYGIGAFHPGSQAVLSIQWSVDHLLEQGKDPKDLKKEYSALMRKREKMGLWVDALPYGHPCNCK